MTRLPAGVWALGIVSLFMDVSSEMVHSLLPLFLVGPLAAPPLAVGLIEGMGEATAAVTKLFSGWLSDRWRKRKALAIAGYGLAALVKPAFPLAGSVWVVAGARFADRLGKGIRGAPRDAMLADMAPPGRRGEAFGLRQSLDTVGAFAGPLIALLLMTLCGLGMRAIFWIAVIPGVFAVAVLAVAVREPPHGRAAAAPRRWRDAGRLGRRFWVVAGLAVMLGFARFGEAFLILRVQGLGLPVDWAPLVLVVMNAAYALTAYPVGRLSDRLGRRPLFAAGLALLVAADGVLAAASGRDAALAGVALWGVHMGLTQGLLSALTADAAPEELRATAFGMMNLLHGFALLAGGAVAGLLWQTVGPAVTYAAAAAAALPTVAVLLWPKAPASP